MSAQRLFSSKPQTTTRGVNNLVLNCIQQSIQCTFHLKYVILCHSWGQY